MLAESRPERTHEAIKRALKLARSNLEETRRSVKDLRAAPLQGYSLAEALTNLIKQERSMLAHTEEHLLGLQESHPVNDPTKYPMNYHYHYSPPQPFPTLPSRVEAGLYRIAQEALTNARKHASASHIKINLIEGSPAAPRADWRATLGAPQLDLPVCSTSTKIPIHQASR